MLRIVFEFVGGPNDGTVLHGQLGEPSDAERYYLFTHHGRLGYRLKVGSPYAIDRLAREQLKKDHRHHFQRHFYVVTDRHESADEVRIWAEYRPDVEG